MKENNNLLTDNIYKLALRYVLPSSLGMAMISMYILFDTIFIGQKLGQTGLTALNISIPIYNLLFGTGILIGVGSATIISISRGKNEMGVVNKTFSHSFVIGILIGLIYSILGLIYINEIIKILGATSNSIGMVKEYLIIVIPSSWSFVMVYNLAALVRNDNGPKRAMIAMGLGGLTNIIFDYIFIFPLNLGMKGAAAATVLSSLVSLSILLWHFIGKFSFLSFKSLRIDKILSLRIFRIGFSSFIVEISSGIVIFLFNKELINFIGDIGVSAYSIIANIALMAGAIFTGISQGLQPIASINYGAGKLDRLHMTRTIGIIASSFVGITFLIAGVFKPEFIISLFTSETGDIIRITKIAIRNYFPIFPIMGINIIMTGYYQSIEQTRAASIISSLRGFIFSFLCLKILTAIFNSNGIWITTPTVECITMIFIIVVSMYKRQISAAQQSQNIELGGDIVG